MSAEKRSGRKKRYSQSEFSFAATRRRSSRVSKANELGKLPVSVLCLSPRAVKWLKARRIETVGGLVEIVSGHLLARHCLDQVLRKEIANSLKPFWDGRNYRSLIAISLLSCGVERVLGDREAGLQPVSTLGFSASLKTWLRVKNIGTVRDLLLQDEEVLRKPRKLGNLLVDEVIVELVRFLSGK